MTGKKSLMFLYRQRLKGSANHSIVKKNKKLEMAKNKKARNQLVKIE
jgi:hypothetical protein